MRRQGPPEDHDDGVPDRLDALFAPRSVAVVGASNDPAKWGHIIARRALGSAADRPVLLVSRSHEVLGRATHPSVRAAAAAVGHPVDLAVLCVPATGFVAAVTDAVDAGVRVVVAITAGLSETGPEGAAREAEAVAVARAGGTAIVGPNCLGVVDHTSDLQLAPGTLPPGDVAVLSQSGNLVLDLAGLLADRGLGISRFVSLGNQADLGVVDFMRACVDHDGTRAVAVYTEDAVDGRGFVSAARALAAAGKPVVLLAPGRSETAARSAISHTGSLTTSSMVIDAACAASGVRRVDHLAQLADLLVALRSPRRMRGRRVAILTDGGGHGAVAAEVLSAAALDTPSLAEPVLGELRSALGPHPSLANPVDLAGAGERDLSSYARGVRVLVDSDQVDGVLLTGYFGGYGAWDPGMTGAELTAAHEMAAAVSGGTTPLVVQTVDPGSAASQVLAEAGIPVHRDVDRAAAVLAGLVEPARTGDVAVPDPAPPVTDASYAAARSLFADAGIAFPSARSVAGPRELEEALASGEIGYPVVLKATGRVHKSDGGGVVLGLADRTEVLAAHADLVDRLAPPSVSVEAMADTSGGTELIVGAVRDPRFGPVVMVGLGGVLTEVLDDTRCALAPVGAAAARDLLLSLQGAPVLLGARGRPPVDLDALAELVARVSLVATAHPELAELELNPVLARPDGVVALDARVVLAEDPS
ncbi:acetate--CoA ligase family protein [Nocardioides aestuarii]|uniref:Acetate--CoA ligase family protein n=1 Tax=Nocardioides aestuarii TaxID=252231 RepID=A0ABW4TR55_9ACTN